MYTVIPVNRNVFFSISKCQKGAIVPPLPCVSAAVFVTSYAVLTQSIIVKFVTDAAYFYASGIVFVLYSVHR